MVDARASTGRIIAVCAVEPLATAATRDDYAHLRASKDYYAFAQQMYPLAKQGDPSAEYYLSSALTYCESLYDWYFIEYTPNGTPRHRTLGLHAGLVGGRRAAGAAGRHGTGRDAVVYWSQSRAAPR